VSGCIFSNKPDGYEISWKRNEKIKKPQKNIKFL